MTIQSIVPTLGFRPSSRALRRLQASTALVAALAPGLAFAGPDGGKVIAGDAIITQNGAVTNITQNSARTVIEWNTFDTAAGEATRFAQPDANSVAINRITGELPSNIR
ncbi:MAG: large exoprotein involved in heme utilization and adhesion, partial [Paracoccaceae bacterium]